MSDDQSRMHRKVSALAYKLLADGKVSAFEYACEHQEPHWINAALTPEQALAASLEGYTPPAKERRLSRGDAEAAAKMAAVCSHAAPWDIAGQKAEQEGGRTNE